jgi:DNA invertase Pin-like site-specific DNA recombinase
VSEDLVTLDRKTLEEIFSLIGDCEVARLGDILVVWRLDRLGRSLKDLIEIMSTLDVRGIGLSQSPPPPTAVN